MPLEYHLDWNDKRTLAYRTFGTDLIVLLDSLGFETNVDMSGDSDSWNGIYDSCAFISKRIR